MYINFGVRGSPERDISSMRTLDGWLDGITYVRPDMAYLSGTKSLRKRMGMPKLKKEGLGNLEV